MTRMYTKCWPAARASVPGIVDSLRLWGSRLGLSRDRALHAGLVAEELVVNILEHGYGGKDGPDIRIRLSSEEQWVVLHLEDHGPAFQAHLAPTPNPNARIEERPPGGLGLFLVRGLADVSVYRREQGCNHWILKFSI